MLCEVNVFRACTIQSSKYIQIYVVTNFTLIQFLAQYLNLLYYGMGGSPGDVSEEPVT